MLVPLKLVNTKLNIILGYAPDINKIKEEKNTFYEKMHKLWPHKMTVRQSSLDIEICL